jgi:flagellar biogenesis protein FliO
MAEKEEKSFMDYSPIIIGILFIVVAIYLFMSGNESSSPSFQPINLFGLPPEYNIASAFGIAK